MTFDEIRHYLRDVAWFWPGVVISIVLAIALSPSVGRVMRVRWQIAMILILGLGLIVSATLTPSREALRFGATGTGTCDLGRIGIVSVEEFLQPSDATFNVLLYIPFGFAIGLFPSSRRKVALILAAITLPFAIEAIQLIVVSLDRACQSADVSDNLTGLVIGLVGGIAVGWHGRSVEREPEDRASDGAD